MSGPNLIKGSAPDLGALDANDTDDYIEANPGFDARQALIYLI